MSEWMSRVDMNGWMDVCWTKIIPMTGIYGSKKGWSVKDDYAVCMC